MRVVQSLGEKVEELLRIPESADVHRRLCIDELAQDWCPITCEDLEGTRKNRGNLRQAFIKRKTCLETKPADVDTV